MPPVFNYLYFSVHTCVVLLQRNSISPGEREKYRTRSPAEPDHKKLKKEEKDMGHVSLSYFLYNFIQLILTLGSKV